MFTKLSISGIHLDAAGLVALADLNTIARRTALIGSASFLDVVYLAPGIHCQQAATEINGGEYPQTADMERGYVFRIENTATVSYLQRVGRPGYLTTVTVSPKVKLGLSGLFGELLCTEPRASLLFLFGVVINVIVIVLLGVIRDWWALGVLGMLMLARLVNVVVIKLRQDKDGCKGNKELPREEGDMLIVLSQDRWIRMKGKLNDLKMVTAGQWLKESTTLDSFSVSFGTLLVYGSAALAGNASTVGSLLVACLLLVSVGILGLSNAATRTQHMFGRMIRVEGERKRYHRRLRMVMDLVEEYPDGTWPERMELMKTEDRKRTDVTNDPVLVDRSGPPRNIAGRVIKVVRKLLSGLPDEPQLDIEKGSPYSDEKAPDRGDEIPINELPESRSATLAARNNLV